MNTWQALKKIVRDQFTRPMPEPWNGKHKLMAVAFMEDPGWGMGDYYAGWVWECSCGVGTSRLIPTHWANTEAKAIDGYKSHRALHEEL